MKGGHWTTPLGWWNGLRSDGSRDFGGPGWGGGSGKGGSGLQDELKVGATCTGVRGPRKVNDCPGHAACTPEGYAIYHRGCSKMDP